MKIRTLLAALVLLSSTTAQAIDFGVGVKAGTLGAGVDFSIALTQTINARLSLTTIDRDFDETLEIEDSDNTATLDSTINLNFGSTALLFDWHVFDGTFHLTAGMLKNDSKLDLQGTITDATVVFDGTSYDVSTEFVDPNMSGKISFGDSFEPYIGLGWGRKASPHSGFSFSAEIGVVLTDPKVTLTAPEAVNPAVQTQLDADVKAAEDAAAEDLSAFEVWPVLSIGLNYAF